jgi:hypothetical protein
VHVVPVHGEEVMNPFIAGLLNAAAAAAKAQAQPRVNKSQPTGCTPCAARGYLEKVKSTYGLDQKRKRK